MTRAAQGLRAWLLQRFTALYLAAFLLYAVARLLLAPPAGHGQWLAWMGQPLTGVATTLFVTALALHAWVGIRDVLIDYVHAVWLRLSLMAAVALLLLGSGLWVMRALLLAAMRAAQVGA